MSKVERKQAESILSAIRYPGERKLISRTTFWRMCNVAGIPERLRRFDSTQFRQLRRVAELLCDGYNYDQIQSLLGVQTNDTSNRSQQQQQQQRVRSEQQQQTQWSTFFGG